MMTNLRRLAIGLALISLLLLLVSGPGTRLGVWAYGTGFLLMRIAFFSGLAGAALALLVLCIPKGRVAGAALLTMSLLLGLGVAYVPWNGMQTVRSLPFIHDISTDTVNPPVFVAILPLRADAPNPPEYLGETVAVEQRKGYPDIKTLALSISADQAFARALDVAGEMGWDIVAADAPTGRIEATDTTFWFGFKDDVVIRVEGSASESKLDIRSKSRIGRSDVGANAARIRQFIAAL